MSEPAPSRLSSAASAGLQHHEQAGLAVPRKPPADRRAAPPAAAPQPRRRGGSHTAGRGRSRGSSSCSGRPASRSRPVRQLPRQRAVPDRSPRPAPRAATACSRRTAPASAGSRAATPAQPRRIEPRQVPPQRRQRPAVARDVVQQQQQHMLVAAQPPERTDAPAAAAPAQDQSPAPPPPTAPPQAPPRRTATTSSEGRAAAAPGSPAAAPRRVREHRAKALVTRHQIAKRPLQRRAHPARRAAAPQTGSCRSRTAPSRTLQTVQEPQPALRIRQRDLRRTRPAPAAAHAPPTHAATSRPSAAHARRLEQAADRRPRPQGSSGSG